MKHGILLTLLIFFLVLELLAFDPSFQTYLIEKHSDAENALEKNTQLLAFFEGGDLPKMTEAEAQHMQDVKRLHFVMQLLIGVFLVWVAWAIAKKKEITKGIFWGMGGIGVLAGLGILFPEHTFSLFHAIFFPQGNFTFTSTSFLITLYPETYFYELAAWWAGISFSILVLTIPLRKIHY